MIESEQRNTYIEDKKLALLVSNLASNMPGTIINSIIISAALWGVIPAKKITIWASVNIAFVLIRYIGLWMYSIGFRSGDFKFWRHLLLISFMISGLLFGSSAIFLVDPAKPEYILFLYFVSGGMVAGALGAYHNYLPVFFAYSTTVFFMPTIVIYNLNTTISSTMSLLGVIFYILSSISAKKMNTDLSESLALRYDNYQLMKNLNIEKKNTEILNAQLMKTNHELKSLTRIDPLTGLKNRRYLFEDFAPHNNKIMERKWLALEGKNKRTVSSEYGYGIFMMDIDKFKLVNDNFGHDSGDMVLKQFSERLIEKVRNDDVAARVGGEEFIIILKDSDEKYLERFAELIRSHIESTTFNITQDRTINITTSIGFVFYPFFENFPMKMTFNQMISLADKGLYYAKQNGRNISVRVRCTGQKSNDLKVVEEITSDIGNAIEQEKIYFEICSGKNRESSKKKRKVKKSLESTYPPPEDVALKF
ncbi:MAG: GGDEF domain-containing protein [Desulfamplus sp.]|nr:GGDEF domain-containing protein [Desulfamplus sp.]